MSALYERLSRWWDGQPGLTGNLALHVDRGIVPCPDQGDVSIEHCLGCPHLRDIHGDPIDWISCHIGLVREREDLSTPH
jgi:hypothetical protein